MKANKCGSRTLHLFTHGGARPNPGPSAIGIVITNTKNRELVSWAESIAPGSNNLAAYKALLKGLRLCKKLTRGAVVCHSSSQLVINQLNGTFRIQNQRLRRHADRARMRSTVFKRVTFLRVPRFHPHIHRASQLLDEIFNDHDHIS